MLLRERAGAGWSPLGSRCPILPAGRPFACMTGPPTPSQVPLRCLRYRRWGLLAASCTAEAAYFAAARVAWHANPRAALWVLFIPYCISSLALMFGK